MCDIPGKGMGKMQSTDGQYSLVKSEMSDSTAFTSSKVKVVQEDISMKKEQEVFDEIGGDDLDHMLLKDRLKLLARGLDSQFKNFGTFEVSEKTVPSGSEWSSLAESMQPISIKLLRKKRRSVTDSVEQALDEDAPGLLQILVEKGVLADEIKLYGSSESDDTLDDLSIEDNFAELESVISKLFSQRPSFIKLAPLQGSKSSKATYCLACLLSLIEQSRYLRFRKWPVEWGWCRDLQAFIFVFQRHNRIVLERPEYGYATYFFELVDTSSIAWQIKRLVTAMKLTSCSRISLIENKALSVGEYLSEGEARVLTEFGWIPNTGLGTMLNYCSRVVHDRQNEKDGSEWRSKIRKLLMDGYTRGSIISTNIPVKIEGDQNDQNPQIKPEP